MATDPVVAESLARGYDKSPAGSYDQAKALGADVGAGMFDPVTMTGYSDTAGQGLGSGFTITPGEQEAARAAGRNVSGTDFGDATDIITTGPGATGIKKLVQDLAAIPGQILDEGNHGFLCGLWFSRGTREKIT